MRFALIAVAVTLIVTATAAPTPKNTIDVDGLIGVDATVKRNAIPEEDLTVGAAGLLVNTKRDFIPDAEDVLGKLSDEATARPEAASKRDAAPEEDVDNNLISVGSVSASIKRGSISDLESEASELAEEAEAAIEAAS